jgi:hypothetical protein
MSTLTLCSDRTSPPARRTADESFDPFTPRSSPTASPTLRPSTVHTFAERYCQAHHLTADEFEQHLLRRTLHPAARWLRPLLRRWDRAGDAADREFVSRVGLTINLREFVIETVEFSDLPANRTILRRHLRLRVSVGRMQDNVYDTMVGSPVE